MLNFPTTQSQYLGSFAPRAILETQTCRRPRCGSPKYNTHFSAFHDLCETCIPARRRWLQGRHAQLTYPPAARHPRCAKPPLLCVELDGLPRRRSQAREGWTEAVDVLGVPRPRFRAEQPGVHRQDLAVHHQGHPRRQAWRQSLSLGKVTALFGAL